MKKLVQLVNALFTSNKAEQKSASVRILTGNSDEKRRLYERALKGADLEQKKILDEYERRFGYQG